VDDVVAVVTDLFFQSRVSAAARAAQRAVRFVSNRSALQGVGPFQLALVDLDATLDPVAAIQTLRAASAAPIVAFGPHVDADGRKAARAAGANRVLAKSRFVTELPRLMERADGAR
jgi:CheY-like chemotaxis protein